MASDDPIISALERAIKKAEKKKKHFPHPEDAHHLPCLRKARASILQSEPRWIFSARFKCIYAKGVLAKHAHRDLRGVVSLKFLLD